jgi:hypothetical protein
MRDRIRERLTEYRTETMESIGIAIAKTTREASRDGRLNSGGFYLMVNEDNKVGFEQYMEQSADFIRQTAPGSWAEYADELRDGANKLKQEIMDRENSRAASLHEPARVKLRNDLDAALDKLIKRKVEDFEWNIGGNDMAATTQNTVTIINSNISNAVVQITQSGKDTISKETAQSLERIINSDEITALPEEERLNVLDQADDVIKELNASVTDKGKVHRGLKRLGNFMSSVGSKLAADVVAQIALAYAKVQGIIP